MDRSQNIYKQLNFWDLGWKRLTPSVTLVNMVVMPSNVFFFIILLGQYIVIRVLYFLEFYYAFIANCIYHLITQRSIYFSSFLSYLSTGFENKVQVTSPPRGLDLQEPFHPQNVPDPTTAWRCAVEESAPAHCGSLLGIEHFKHLNQQRGGTRKLSQA